MLFRSWLGTGTPSSSNYLRGDGAWTALPASAVTSVFTRTGAVVAATGDYTAAQVTNAVSTIGSYADPSWITSLAYAKITGAPTISAIQTPWLSNIAAAGFNLTNAGTLNLSNFIDFLRDGGSGRLFINGTQDTFSGFEFRTTSGGSLTTKMTIANAGQVSAGVTTTSRTGTILSVVNPTNATTAAQATQFIIAEQSNAAGYQFQLGYAVLTGGVWVGCVQALAGGAGSHLLLNPLGGNVGIGTSAPGSKLSVVGLPTSSAGLAAGDIWVDVAGGKVLKIV